MQDEMGKYKEAFLTEARGHLEMMNAALLKLEKSPGKASFLSDIFRAAHTLKGMAAAMEYGQTAALCHALEDLLDGIRKKKLKVDHCADALFAAFDTLSATLRAMEQGGAEQESTGLVERLKGILKGVSAPVPDSEAASDTAPAPLLEKIQTIQVKVDQLDQLMNLAEELVVNKMRLEKIKESLQNPELSAAIDTLGRLVTEVQYQITQARMVPINFVLNRFPRMVRDLARQQKKEVELKTEGGEIELDRMMIDEIGEALVHLLRNAVDHGLETPEERKRQGKAPQGLIKISTLRTKDLVTIEVADDGRGLDLEEVRRLGISRGLLSPRSSSEEVMATIFAGLSTAKGVTAVSGRGLGLDIVKRKIESLGGTIKVTSDRKKGTAFLVQIPLTLAIIKTLFVQVGGRSYCIPLSSIERIVSVSREEIKGMLEFEAFVLDGDDIPITRLDKLFGVEGLNPKRLPIVVVHREKDRVGLLVDGLLSTEEIVIKPLNRLIRENRYFAGSAIIGTGEVILVLDVGSLLLTKKEVIV